MLNLHVVIASTRPGRQGPAVGSWFLDHAKKHGKFNIELVDLKEVNLPMFDEPNHPRLKQYVNEHTKAWSAIVDRADAFVFVTPEYNYNSPPSLINAMDFLLQEWAYKPVGFVSYGGVSGGTRSVQMTKLMATSLKMMPMVESVHIPFFNKQIDKESGKFLGSEVNEKAGDIMLDELLRWAEALKTLRS